MPPETLLLVDDERDVVDALARTVRNRGYRILEATSAARALEIIDHEHVDLVISDIAMPEVSGLELMSRVRRSHPRIVRFLLTGFASLESALVAINDGEVDRYLTKPWDTDELRAAVRDALDRKKLPVPLGAPAATPTPPLSPRLRQTLERLAAGACPKDIASDLGVSVHTARQYVKILYRRFEVSTRAELLVKIYGAAR